jgi:hypothetical protein
MNTILLLVIAVSSIFGLPVHQVRGASPATSRMAASSQWKSSFSTGKPIGFLLHINLKGRLGAFAPASTANSGKLIIYPPAVHIPAQEVLIRCSF